MALLTGGPTSLAAQTSQASPGIESCSPGAAFLSRGRYQQALAVLRLLPANEQSSAANLRGLAEMMTGKPEAALATFDAAIADGDAREELRFNRAVVLLKLRRFELASTALSPLTASQDLSMSTRARLHLAIALEGQGKLPAAEAELLEALRLDDAYDDAWVYLGALRERRGDFRQAGEAYKAHLKRHPDAVVSLLRFGIVAWRAGYPDTAVKQLRRVRELAPNSVEAAEAAKFLLLLE